MPDIFLSYSRDDRSTARRFAEAFERAGFSVWWDQTLSSGEAFDEVIEKALKEAGAVVVLWSKQSVGSRWVRAEATVGDRNKTLVPVEIEPCQRPVIFELTHTAVLSHWTGDPGDAAWLGLIADVRKLLGRNQQVSASVVDPQAARLPLRIGPRVSLIAICTLIAAGAWWLIANHGNQPAKAAVTLAVLPFSDMSPAHDQEYFSDGLSEEILNQLAQIKSLNVTARTSSFAFKGKNEDMRVIGKKLGVANLLEGSIRKDDSNLRITAQLINARSGAHLWSKTYDREMSKIFAVQEEIAKDVAKALSIKLDVGELSRAVGGTTNVEAYEEYLAGIALFNRSSELLLRAIDRFHRAVALDPSFAAAWVMLGSTHLAYAGFTGKEVSREASTAFDEAKRLLPDSPDNYLVSAQIATLEFAWTEALRQIHMARTLTEKQGRSLASVDWTEADFLQQVGRIKESIDFLLRARSSDPLELGIVDSLAVAYLESGNNAALMALLEQEVQQRNSPFLRRVFIHFAMSARDRIRIDKWMDIAIDLDESELPLLVVLKPLMDRPKEALARLRQIASGTSNPNDLGRIAIYAAFFRDPEFVMQLLVRINGYHGVGRGVSLPVVIWNPLLVEVRKKPEFKSLVRDMGLVDYWRDSGNWSDFCQPVGDDDFECH